MHAGSTAERALLWGLLPVAVVQVGLFVVPMAIMFLYSFWTTRNFQIVPTFTLDNYRAFFESWTYPRVLLRTLGTALVITAATLVLAYPLAYFIVRYTRRWQKVLLAAVILSFWTSGLLRAYAWMAVLGHGGIINKGLRSLGLIDAPLPFLLYSPFSVVLVMTYFSLPFAVVAIYASLEKMDWALLHAAGDLGAPAAPRLLARDPAPDHARGGLGGRADLRAPGRDVLRSAPRRRAHERHDRSRSSPTRCRPSSSAWAPPCPSSSP